MSADICDLSWKSPVAFCTVSLLKQEERWTESQASTCLAFATDVLRDLSPSLTFSEARVLYCSNSCIASTPHHCSDLLKDDIASGT